MRDAAFLIHPAGSGVPPAVMNLLELLELWAHSYFVKIESAKPHTFFFQLFFSILSSSFELFLQEHLVIAYPLSHLFLIG